MHAEHAALVKDIKSDLTALMQLKHSLRDLKEQDLVLANRAEELTDQDLCLLDFTRLSIHTTRKAKQQIIQQRRSSEQADWTSFYESIPRHSEEFKKTESPFNFNSSHLDTPSGSPAADPQKGARSITRYTQSFTIREDNTHRDNHVDTDDNDLPAAERDDEDVDTFAQFAKMMGDNLVALRKKHEGPPKWNGPRIKIFRGRPKVNVKDFEDDIRSSCASLKIILDKGKVRYMKRFLDGDTADFVSTLTRSGNYTLDEVFTKLKERFEDNRSQTDFLYMFTMRRQYPNNETIREYSHDLCSLVSKTYPNVERMEVLKQKFLSSIKVEDFEKTVLSHDLTTATF